MQCLVGRPWPLPGAPFTWGGLGGWVGAVSGFVCLIDKPSIHQFLDHRLFDIWQSQMVPKSVGMSPSGILEVFGIPQAPPNHQHSKKQQRNLF